MFPFASTQAPGTSHSLNVGHSAAVAGLVDLVDQIPNELITLEGREYATFVMSVAAIRDVLALWRSGSQPGFDRSLVVVPGLSQVNPVALIRTGLMKCPDDAPSRST